MILFHPLRFASTDEAAAFIAALSRALNSPDRVAVAKTTGSVEVWIDRAPSQAAAVVYLSDAALDAAVAAFPPVPVLTAVPNDMLYLVVEHFNGDPVSVYRRFRDQGRMAPDGLRYLQSWVTADFERCFQIMANVRKPRVLLCFTGSRGILASRQTLFSAGSPLMPN